MNTQEWLNKNFEAFIVSGLFVHRFTAKSLFIKNHKNVDDIIVPCFIYLMNNDPFECAMFLGSLSELDGLSPMPEEFVSIWSIKNSLNIKTKKFFGTDFKLKMKLLTATSETMYQLEISFSGGTIFSSPFYLEFFVYADAVAINKNSEQKITTIYEQLKEDIKDLL